MRNMILLLATVLLLGTCHGVTAQDFFTDGAEVVDTIEINGRNQAPELTLIHNKAGQDETYRFRTTALHLDLMGGITGQTRFMRIRNDSKPHSFLMHPDGIAIGMSNNTRDGSGFSFLVPQSAFHVYHQDSSGPFGNAQVILEDNTGTNATRTMVRMLNNGPSNITFEDTSTTSNTGVVEDLWTLGPQSSGAFVIEKDFGTTAFAIDEANQEVVIQPKLQVLPIFDAEDPATAKITVDNSSYGTGLREMFALINNGGSRFTMENTANNVKWAFASDAIGRFTFSVDGTSGPEFAISPSGRVIMGPGNQSNFDLRPNGNLTIRGTLTQSSDRNLKKNFAEVDVEKVLQKVAEMPVSTWQFKFDSDDLRHMGPTAQDFRKAFGLGENDRTIAPVDGIGVSLAAIKALKAQVDKLNEQLAEKSQLVSELESELESQRDRFDSLEGRLSELESR